MEKHVAGESGREPEEEKNKTRRETLILFLVGYVVFLLVLGVIAGVSLAQASTEQAWSAIVILLLIASTSAILLCTYNFGVLLANR